MFNIKQGMVSLDVNCTQERIFIRIAPDNRSFTPLVSEIIKSERTIANLHLRHMDKDEAEDMEARWMSYYHKRGYQVTKLTPMDEWGEPERRYL